MPSTACIPLSQRFSSPFCSQALISRPSLIKLPKPLPKQRLTDPLLATALRSSLREGVVGPGWPHSSPSPTSQAGGGLVKSFHEALSSFMRGRGGAPGSKPLPRSVGRKGRWPRSCRRLVAKPAVSGSLLPAVGAWWAWTQASVWPPPALSASEDPGYNARV